MPRGRNVRVDGLTEAKAALASLPAAFRDAAVDTLDVGSRITLMETLARVPVGYRELEPGHIRLKESLGRNVRSDGLQVAVGFGDHTAKFVEFGTNDTRPQPSLSIGFRYGKRYVRKRAKGWVGEAGQRMKVSTKTSKGSRIASRNARIRTAFADE